MSVYICLCGGVRVVSCTLRIDAAELAAARLCLAACAVRIGTASIAATRRALCA